MPDISMCANENCERKEIYYRFMATPSEWQSYIKPDENNCEMFWEIEKDEF